MGRKRLKDQFGYEIPSDHTGECWAISAHENGDCEVAEGEYKGQRLSVLWQSIRNYLAMRMGVWEIDSLFL